MSNVLFLDVDGVLNGDDTKVKSPCGFTGVDRDKIHLLSQAVISTGCDVVLSSDWKMDFDFNNPVLNAPDAVYLEEELEKEGIQLKGTTPDVAPYMREKEIISWLMDHPEVEDYCILDDTMYGFAEEETASHFIHTNIFGNGIFDAYCYSDDDSSDFTKQFCDSILKQNMENISSCYKEETLSKENHDSEIDIYLSL